MEEINQVSAIKDQIGSIRKRAAGIRFFAYLVFLVILGLLVFGGYVFIKANDIAQFEIERSKGLEFVTRQLDITKKEMEKSERLLSETQTANDKLLEQISALQEEIVKGELSKDQLAQEKDKLESLISIQEQVQQQRQQQQQQLQQQREQYQQQQQQQQQQR